MPVFDRCEPLDYQALSDHGYMGIAPTCAQMSLEDVSSIYAPLQKNPVSEENLSNYSGAAHMGSTYGSMSDPCVPPTEQSMRDSPVAAGCRIYPCSCPCAPINVAINGVGDCVAKCNVECCCAGLCKVVCGLLCGLR